LSHIVQIQTQVRDPGGVAAACRRLALPQPIEQTVELFAAKATGLTVQLPGWRYPIVCDLAEGRIEFDNFGGSWGDQVQLDQFLQAYATEKSKLEARKRGHTVTEQALADGSIRLTIQVAGGAE
jgi:hypothetical protein